MHNQTCIFCGSRTDIQLHHIIQKRFNGSDTPDNLVPVCPHCHKTYHFLTNQLLNYLLVHKKIENHQIRPTPPIKVPEPIISQLPAKEKTFPTVTITGGEVTINFH
jgi:glutaredoxin